MRKKVFFLTFAFIVFIFQIVTWQFFFRPADSKKITVMNEGWDVTYNDTQFKDVKLSALRRLIGNGTHKGDVIILSRNIDPLYELTSPTLMFESRFSAWKLRFGGTEISNHYYDRIDKNRYIGRETNYVNVPRSTGTVLLEIELCVSEDGAYSFYEAPVIGNYRNVILYTVYKYLFIFLASTFLITFGMMFLAITIGFRSTLPEIRMQTFSSLLFIDLGIWFLTQFNLLSIFVNTHGHETELEYISLYLVVPLMYLVMGSMRDYLKDKIYITFASISTLVALAPVLLHIFNIGHINNYLILYQLNALVFIIFMITLLIRDHGKSNITSSQKIQIAGQGILGASFVFNVFFYYLEVAGIYEQIMISKVIVPLGALTMVFATLINYYIYISESYARKKENASLAYLAYADGLTGLANRSKYEKYLKELDQEDNDYCIVSIDLNDLKKVNDKSGHLMGDKYLSEFADTLKKCAGKNDMIARIGGDEFVLILTGTRIKLGDSIMQEVATELEKLNAADRSYHRSAAYGYAFRLELTGSKFNQIYLLADERMYKMKTQMKQKHT
jgi:diguanylate cyclase (GGDEF)-like protein